LARNGLSENIWRGRWFRRHAETRLPLSCQYAPLLPFGSVFHPHDRFLFDRDPAMMRRIFSWRMTS
jgi:hypothetical protein